jgi:nitrogen fixation protein NifU and related proteins
MASDALYDDLVMEHIRNARNFRTLGDADRQAQGTNVVCGDELSIYLKLDGERIDEVSFQCSCCGVSMASASIMTERVTGMTIAAARAAVKDVVGLLEGTREAPLEDKAVRAVAATASRFPARRRCAELPWLTLEAALREEPGVALT